MKNEKYKFLSENLEAQVEKNLGDYTCPKIQTLILKVKEYDWR